MKRFFKRLQSTVPKESGELLETQIAELSEKLRKVTEKAKETEILLKESQENQKSLENTLQEEKAFSSELQKSRDKLVSDVRDFQEKQKQEAARVRERIEKDAQREKDFAVEGFAKGMLTVHDTLEEASRHLPEQYANGVRMVTQVLLKEFRRFGVEIVLPKEGEAMDTNIHEATYTVHGKQHGTVFKCEKAGFTLKGKVLRAASVGVYSSE